MIRARSFSISLCLSLFLLASSVLLFLPASSFAQTSQPYLFSSVPPSSSQPNSGSLTFLRDDSAGTLTLLPASPSTFNDACLPTAADPKGRFLYAPCGDGLAMYSLSSTGALTEIPASPFAASRLTGFANAVVVPESTGQYVYLLKSNYSGSNAAQNLYLDAFQVDPSTPTLVPLASQELNVAGLLSRALADPNGHGLALFLGRNSNASPNPDAFLYAIAFDPVSGLATLDPSGGQVLGHVPRAAAISPTGGFLAVTYGADNEPASLVGFSISPSTFALNSLGVYSLGIDQTFVLGSSIFFNPSASILYVQAAVPDNPSDGLGFLLFDPATYLLLPTSPLPFSGAANVIGLLQDPQGPFEYSAASGGGVDVFYIDPVSGRASQSGTVSSPFYPGLGLIAPILAPLGPSGGQSVSGPVLSLSLPSLAFPQTTAGQSSAPQFVALKNVGGEVVNLTSISLAGPNPADFQLTSGCNPPVLPANQSCALSVVYSPASAGTSAATIVISSNVPESPQYVALSGISVAPVSQVSFSPAAVNFPATTQGASSSPIVLTLTNTGGAPLHIAGTSIGGNNVADFSFAPTTCSGAIDAGASCTLTITFTPLASGIRSATWTVADDASSSPQIVSISGTGLPAAQIGAASSGGNTTATVSAGQPAQFNLQATPGNGFTGTLAFSCSGVPFGATCVPPASLPVSSGSIVPFTVSVDTLGASALVSISPISNSPHRRTPWLPLAFAATLLATLLVVLSRHPAGTLPLPRAATISATVLSLCLFFSVIGCSGGGGSNSVTPPPQQSAATPAIQPAGGAFSAPQSVSIADSTPNATIYFTTDGSTPTPASSVFSAPFSLNSAATIKAMAAAPPYTNSSVATAAFTFRSPAGSSKSLPLAPILLTLVVN